eukprot:CAMPEP_0196589296 /NCGR_PEP_ID=MMETSP1081-20130531/63242_1 /TAXON_ID=36882 /ORGANISM="Pyramimonas amylifera, Strain CCMP720" /LENGTH=60 /DNA_ID=CAMNT_0041912059 /DNA_START=113 /DNA_END=295 /DNA_ORIENTATION=-
MTRGNQRETDRARAAARADKNKPKNTDGLTPQQRNERDALALIAKKEAKEKQKQDQAAKK